MTYERLKELKPSEFKRRCGVHRETFEKMVEVLRPNLNRQGFPRRTVQVKCGRPTTDWSGILPGVSDSISHRAKLGGE